MSKQEKGERKKRSEGKEVIRREGQRRERKRERERGTRDMKRRQEANRADARSGSELPSDQNIRHREAGDALQR